VTSDLLGPYAQALAWALVHFLWQGALLGLAAVWMMRAPRFGASARYAIGVASLAAMFAAPIATTAWLSANPAAGWTAMTPALTSSGRALARPTASASTSQLRGARGIEPRDSVQSAFTQRAAAARPVLLPVVPVLVVWLAGVALLTARLAGNWLAVRRLIRHSVRPVDVEIHRLARRMAGRLALDRVVRICESTRVAVPLMVGWLKPVVLLPASAMAGLAPTQIEALIAHELAHVRRHDYLVNLLQSVVETLLFYHPAVWWVSKRVRAEREHCCDDLVVGVCDRLAYVTALADLAAMVVPPRVALAASDGSLLERVRRILGVDPDNRLAASGSVSGLLALLAASLLLPAALVLAQSSSPGATARPAAAAARAVAQAGGVATAQPATSSASAPAAKAAAAAQPQTARPADSLSETRQSSGGGTGEFTWQENSEKVSIKWTGKFTIADDDRDISWVESGRTVEISDGGWVLTTGVVIRGMPDGSVQHTYRRSGFERPYEPEGREFLQAMLVKVIRRTGFGAESRVARFLKNGGVDAVFAEIAKLEGDYVRRVYYTELIKQATLTPAELTRVAKQASETISSDYELGNLLKTAGKQAGGDEGALIALIDATKTIGSDYEQHQALAALLPSPPSPKVAAAVLAAATDIGSDYERATLLMTFTRRGGLTSAVTSAFFSLVTGMQSAYEQSRTLQTVMTASGISDDIVADARKASSAVDSDYERRQVLTASMPGPTLSSKDAAGIIEAAGRIKSDNERANVLIDVAKKGGVTPETAPAFCALVGSTSSAYEQRRVLETVIARPHLDDAVVAQVLKAAGTIKSNFDRAETLIAVAKRQTLTATSRPLYLAAADGIHSDYDQTRALAELVRSERTIK